VRPANNCRDRRSFRNSRSTRGATAATIAVPFNGANVTPRQVVNGVVQLHRRGAEDPGYCIEWRFGPGRFCERLGRSTRRLVATRSSVRPPSAAGNTKSALATVLVWVTRSALGDGPNNEAVELLRGSNCKACDRVGTNCSASSITWTAVYVAARQDAARHDGKTRARLLQLHFKSGFRTSTNIDRNDSALTSSRVMHQHACTSSCNGSSSPAFVLVCLSR